MTNEEMEESLRRMIEAIANFKIAVLLVGHMRTYKKTYESFYKNVLTTHKNVDVFITTWDTTGTWQPEMNRDGRSHKYHGTVDLHAAPIDIEDIKSRYNPKELEVYNYNDLTKTIEELAAPVYAWRDTLPELYRAYRVNSYIAQYMMREFSQKKFHEYCQKNNKEYDAVILTRPDVEFLTDPSNGYPHAWNCVNVAGTTNTYVGWINEIVFLTDVRKCDIICSVASNYTTLFEDAKRENRPHTFFEPHNLYYHLMKTTNKMTTVDMIDARIVR